MDIDALIELVENNSLCAMQQVIANGEDVAVCSSRALRCAAHHNLTDMVALLLPYSDGQADESYALYMAVKHSNEEMLRILLPHSNVNEDEAVIVVDIINKFADICVVEQTLRQWSGEHSQLKIVECAYRKKLPLRVLHIVFEKLAQHPDIDLSSVMQRKAKDRVFTVENIKLLMPYCDSDNLRALLRWSICEEPTAETTALVDWILEYDPECFLDLIYNRSFLLQKSQRFNECLNSAHSDVFIAYGEIQLNYGNINDNLNDLNDVLCLRPGLCSSLDAWWAIADETEFDFLQHSEQLGSIISHVRDTQNFKALRRILPYASVVQMGQTLVWAAEHQTGVEWLNICLDKSTVAKRLEALRHCVLHSNWEQIDIVFKSLEPRCAWSTLCIILNCAQRDNVSCDQQRQWVDVFLKNRDGVNLKEFIRWVCHQGIFPACGAVLPHITFTFNDLDIILRSMDRDVEHLKLLVPHFPSTVFNNLLGWAATINSLACVQFLLPQCDPKHRNSMALQRCCKELYIPYYAQQFRHSMNGVRLQRQQQIFDLLYPLSDPYKALEQLKTDEPHLSWAQLEQRMHSEQLHATLSCVVEGGSEKQSKRM